MGTLSNRHPDDKKTIEALFEHCYSRKLTRRSFLAVAAAAGLAVTVPLGEGRYMHAYAADVDHEDYVVFVLDRWDVGICFYDVSSGTNKPVPGAKITITSLFNQKTATGTTDEYGIATIDVQLLAEDDAAGAKRETYQFWGSILAEKDGYRIYETGKQRIATPCGVDAATQPLDEHPYAQCITFDGYDIQYAKEAAFATTAANDRDHEILLKVHAGPNKTLDAAFQNNGAEKGRVGSVATDNTGVGSARFSGKWLQLGSTNCFPVGSKTSVSFSVDGTTTQIATTLAVLEGCIEDAVNSSDGSAAIDPAEFEAPGGTTTDVEAKSPWSDFLTLPTEGMPKFLRGLSLSAPIPIFPVKYEFSPFGKALVGYGFDVSLGRDNSGNPDALEWKNNAEKSAKEQFERTTEKWSKAFNDVINNTMPGATPPRYSLKPTTTLDFNVIAAAMAGLEWSKDAQGNRLWKGSLRAFIKMILSLNVVEQLSIEGIPVAYVGFDCSLAAGFMGIFVIQTPHTDPSGSQVGLVGGTGIELDLTITVGVSAGIGQAGIFSIGVRGYVYLKLYVGLIVPPKGKEFPHLVVSAGAGVQGVAVAFIFKLTFNIYSHEWPSLYNNWNSQLEGSNYTDYTPVTLPDNEVFYVSNGLNGRGFSVPGVIGTSPSLTGLGDIDDLAVAVTNSEMGMTNELLAAGDEEDYLTFSASSGAGICTGIPCTTRLNGLGLPGAEVNESLIYENVFVDPRVKVVDIDGRKFMFRITTIEYPGEEMRTRFTYAEFVGNVWQEPRPIVYELDNTDDFARIETYDYDFDILKRPESSAWPDGGAVRVLITGGTRPSGDGTTLSDAAAHTMLSFLSLDVNMAPKSKRFYKDCYRKAGQDDQMFLFPRLVDVPAVNGIITIVLALMRTAPQGKLFAKGQFTDRAAIAGINGYGSEAFGFVTAAIDGAQDEKHDLAVIPTRFSVGGFTFGFSTYDETREKFVTKVTNAMATYYGPGFPVILRIVSSYALEDVFNIRPWNGGFLGKKGSDSATSRLMHFTYLYGVDEPVYDPNAIELVGPPGQEIGLFKDELFESGNSPIVGDIGFSEADVSPPGFGVDQFAVSDDGGMLYFSVNQEGKVPDTIHPDGSTTPGNPIKLYQILGSRCVTTDTGGLSFYDPFPFVKLQHPADQLTNFTSLAESAFIYSSITSMETGATNLYYCAVPLITCITLLGFASVNTFVCRGETADFHVTIRNDGNTVISEFIVIVYTDAGFYEEVTVNMGVENIVPGIDDTSSVGPGAMEGLAASEWPAGYEPREVEFDIPTAAGVCIPGKEKTYRFSLGIPDIWDKEQTVHVTIKPGSAKVSDVPAFKEFDHVAANAIDGTELTNEPKSVDLILVEHGSDPNDLEVGANHYQRTGPSPDPDDGGGGGKRMPDTGDDLLSSPLAGIAAAAVGAGAAGIVAERIINTRKEEGDDPE